MIKPIIRDMMFLSQPSVPAAKSDQQVMTDLVDTLNAHLDGCVGMAANMIGVHKRIIVVRMGPMSVAMVNPEIVAKSGAYETEEGCLSLLGGPRPCKRYKTIKVKYQTLELQTRIKTYTGWTAQIIQHEVDHCDGVLV